jgi:3-methyladenine DNA glycosylase AlkD
MLEKLKLELENSANSKQAEILQRFFKTRKGEYGEGDIFLGIKIPIQRSIAKKYYALELNNLQELLDKNIHEHRMIALIILVEKYKKNLGKEEIFNFYLKNSKRINNWDLVDISSPHIIGDFLHDKPKEILYKLAKSENLWEKRISIISTLNFIRKNKFEDTLKISEILLKDKHDLIHKAVGWMLREVGKRNLEVEEEFLKKHYSKIHRTTLRYAIEKFEENKRKNYLKNKFN